MSRCDLASGSGLCRVLPRAERAGLGGRLRGGRMYAHLALSRLVGRPGLEWMLAAGLKSAMRNACEGFAVPLPYALTAFGDRLRLELPTSTLDLRLADWVQCRGRILHVGDYFLGSCDWKYISLPLTDTGVMREAAELSRCGFDYRSTPSYRRYRQGIEAGRPIRRNKITLSSEALIDAYFERYLKLFRSIEAHGVLPVNQARAAVEELSAESVVRSTRTELFERDIGVAIGPEGQIYCLPGGKHRTAIAKVLGIARVPVEVRLVSRGWVRAMQARHGGSLFEAVTRGIAELEAGYIAESPAIPATAECESHRADSNGNEQVR